MAILHDIEASITGLEPTAPPSWVNARLGFLNESTVLHSGGGSLNGGWHSQDSDEVLVVLSGRCTVHVRNGELVAGPGQLIHISADEAHRVEAAEGTTLLAIESATARRTNLAQPGE